MECTQNKMKKEDEKPKSSLVGLKWSRFGKGNQKNRHKSQETELLTSETQV